jgi:putative transposase
MTGSLDSHEAGHLVALTAARWLARRVLEHALIGEINQHVGYHRYEAMGRNHQNSRNGWRTKTLRTDLGPIQVRYPRDRYGTFEPVVVRKRQLQVNGLARAVSGLLSPQVTPAETVGRFREVCPDWAPSKIVNALRNVSRELGDEQRRPLLPEEGRVVLLGTARSDLSPQCAAPAGPVGWVVGAIDVTSPQAPRIVRLETYQREVEPDPWQEFLACLASRGLRTVGRVKCDDRPELVRAVRRVWPSVPIEVVSRIPVRSAVAR